MSGQFWREGKTEAPGINQPLGSKKLENQQQSQPTVVTSLGGAKQQEGSLYLKQRLSTLNSVKRRYFQDVFLNASCLVCLFIPKKFTVIKCRSTRKYHGLTTRCILYSQVLLKTFVVRIKEQ